MNLRIGPAKGRPMLQWIGKQPLTHVTAFPAQTIESFDPQGKATHADPGGLLFHGDNKEVLTHLIANGYRGMVDLVYIDPPFDSGADYVRRVSLRGPKGTAKLDGEGYTLGEQIQYTDIWVKPADGHNASPGMCLVCTRPLFQGTWLSITISAISSIARFILSGIRPSCGVL